MNLTTAQNHAADAILVALEASAALVSNSYEGSAGHLRDDAVDETRSDLKTLRGDDPQHWSLKLESGAFLTFADWFEEATSLLAAWHRIAPRKPRTIPSVPSA